MKSCQSCPSFVGADEVPIVFGKAIGAPMCARYGHVLGRPGLSESGHDTLAAYRALNCDAYGQPRPDKPTQTHGGLVMRADPAVTAKVHADDFEADELATCRSCSNCVHNSMVANELGFTVDVCKAKGKLILRPQNQAKGCPFAIAGSMSMSTDGLELRPEFREGFTIPTEMAVNAVTSVGNTQAEPTTYVSDLPIEPEDREAGIRAWRVIKQPDGPNSIPIPIFSRDIFTAEEIMLIPQTGDDNHPELYVDYDHKLYRFAVDGYELGETIALQGLPGVGKTEFARWVAWLMQVPFHRIAFDNSSEADLLIGSKEVEATEHGPQTTFVVGRTALALERPGIILYDELNLAPDEVRQSLRTLFDTGTMVIDKASPAIHIRKDPYCIPMVAQNPSWDVRNSGTADLAGAEYSRLSPLAVELPPEAVERHILTERCKVDRYAIPAGTLDIIMKVNEDLRVLSEQQTIPFTWGIRESIKFARKTRWYSLPTALKATALDFYEPQVAEVCLKVLADHTPQ